MNNSPNELPPLIVNGRRYPLWSQFVHGKSKWIGGTLQEMPSADGAGAVTTITDIKLIPNGTDSATFCVCGKDFDDTADVKILGIDGHNCRDGWTHFHAGFGSWAMEFRIKPPNEVEIHTESV